MRVIRLLGLAVALIAAQGPKTPLGEPAALAPTDIVALPSSSVRSAVLELADNPPAQRVRFDFVCMASHDGAIFDCLAESAHLPADANWLDFIRTAGVDDKAAVDHSLVSLARLQARRTVLRARADRPQAYLVRLSETLDPSAHVNLQKPTKILAFKDLRFISAPDSKLMSALYPMAALRHGASARVTVRCRVQLDRSLFCYGGKTSDGLRPGDAEDFALATYQLWSIARVEPKTTDGQDAIGAEVELSTNWQLGE